MNKIKKTFCVLIAVVIFSSLFIFTASADNTDSSFSINISNSSNIFYNANAQRKKDNYTSVYAKYNSGPAMIQAIIYGASGANGTYYDCTTYRIGDNSRRPDAIIKVGQKGYIKQDVREWFGASAWARFALTHNSGFGTAKGLWSPDSVWESGCIDYN